MAEILSYEKNKHDPNKTVSYPGEYSLDSVTIDGVDFLAKVATIIIFEDLNLPYVTGELIVVDTQNIASFLPLIGGETLKFKIRDCYMVEKEFEFILGRVSDRKPVSLSSMTYRVKFVSKSYINTKAKKISKAYPKMRTEECFMDVASLYLDIDPKNIKWVPTASPISCIIPNWRAAHAMKWLASRSICSRAEFSNSPYVVFEEKTGDIFFLPLDFLYNENTNVSRGKIQVKYGRNTMDDNASIAYHERMGVHQLSLEDFEIIKTTDYGENLENGMYNNMVQQVDAFARDSSNFNHSYEVDFPDSQHLNKYPFLREGDNALGGSNVSYWQTIPKNDGLFSDMDSSSVINPKLYSHISKWQQTEQMIVRGVLPGSFELRIGQKYELEIPSYRDATSFGIQEKDPYFSGNYIVEAIKHEFAPSNKYFATVQMFTDSLDRKIEKTISA